MWRDARVIRIIEAHALIIETGNYNFGWEDQLGKEGFIMKKGKKFLSLLLAGAMTVSLAACGSDDTTATTPADTPASDSADAGSDAGTDAGTDAEAESEAPEAAAIDTSERVDLVFYVMGDAPTDEQAVEDALNEKLLEKANATIDFQFSTWTDFQQKYSLEITSGSADLIYIANWLNYGQLATSGAFLELGDLLDTYAPELKELVGENQLNMCSVDGEIYAVPNAWPEYVCNGFKYREDLRKEYDLPVPNSIENAEAYFLGIQENMPNQGILTVTTEESQGTQTAFDAAWVLNFKYPWVYTNGLSYGLAADTDSPSEVYDYWFSDDFVDDMNLMKKWADYGFWSKSALSDTNDSESFKTGLCVAELAGQNPNKYITAINDFKDGGQGWEAAYIAYGETTGSIYPGHATQNGTAVVRGCKNPERAIYVLQLLMCDQELNDLVSYGIKGTHYDLDEDGFYVNLSDTFNYEGFNTWNLRNGEYKLLQPTDVVLNELFDKYEDLGSKTKYPNTDIYSGFTENYDSYSAERTAVINVMRQYLAPLQAGLVSDVDAAVEEFRTKVKDAGLDTVRESYTEQWKAYCEAYGYE